MSIKIENVVLPSPQQWEAIIRGTRNPKNSWNRMDSYATFIEDPETLETANYEYFIGPNDQDLLERLAAGGPVHAKYRRMIPVYLDITAPLYWWKEFDTYKLGTVTNSCSTMHKIHAKEFTLEDFSYEHLLDDEFELMKEIIKRLNADRISYLELSKISKEDFANAPKAIGITDDSLEKAKKKIWWQMIQLLPSSYNQKRTVMLNYEVLANIYKWRKDHKLDEWHVLCDWIESLPYSELITGVKKDD